MQRINKRVESKKEEIQAELAKGYQVHAVAKVFEFDVRTLKRAISRWEQEDAAQALKTAADALEASQQK